MSHSSPAPTTPFLELPPEVRNEIYTWLFPTGRSAAQLLTRHNGGYISMSDRLGLLATCKQIHEEVSSLLRGQRRFKIVQSTTFLDIACVDKEGYRNLGLLEYRIMRHLIPCATITIHYDLDTHVMNNNIPPLLQTCRDLRQSVAEHMFAKVVVQVSITNRLRELRQWIDSGRYMIQFENLSYDTRIVLRFPQPDDGDSSDTFLRAGDLIWATQLDTDSDESWNPAIISTTSEDAANEEKVFLLSLYSRLLLFIHTILMRTAGDLDPCPEIWINKDLEVSHVDLEQGNNTVKRLTNRYSKRTYEEICRFIEAGDLIRHYYNIKDPCQNTTNSDCRPPDTDEEEVGTPRYKTLRDFAKKLSVNLYNFMYE